MAVESIFYSVAGMSCRGALIWDEGVKAPRPLLLMAPNWRGVIKPAIETAQMLAGEGYVVFVADMFGEGNGPVGTENPMEFLRPFMSDAVCPRRLVPAEPRPQQFRRPPLTVPVDDPSERAHVRASQVLDTERAQQHRGHRSQLNDAFQAPFLKWISRQGRRGIRGLPATARAPPDPIRRVSRPRHRSNR